MKVKTYFLNSVLVNKFFRPIREKKDIILVLLESIRLMLNDITIPPEKSCGKLVLYIGKESRLIYISERKYFSINFPFFLDNSSDCLIYDKNDLEIDSKIISQIMEVILDRNIINSQDFLSFLDAVDSIYEEVNIWKFFFELLTFEDGYIRFDNDIDHIDVNHPQYHIDIFYENHNKIKFGLHDNINDDSFYQLVVNDDFYFLNKMIYNPN